MNITSICGRGPGWLDLCHCWGSCCSVCLDSSCTGWDWLWLVMSTHFLKSLTKSELSAWLFGDLLCLLTSQLVGLLSVIISDFLCLFVWGFFVIPNVNLLFLSVQTIFLLLWNMPEPPRLTFSWPIKNERLLYFQLSSTTQGKILQLLFHDYVIDILSFVMFP